MENASETMKETITVLNGIIMFVLNVPIIATLMLLENANKLTHFVPPLTLKIMFV